MKKENLIYQSKSGKIEFRGDLKKDTIWGTQKQIADLFNISQPVVSRHINNILKDKEIDKKSNMQKMHIAFSDKPVTFYSLDMILSVGYRTNSKVAINFRKWATKTLKQHLLEGYTINGLCFCLNGLKVPSMRGLVCVSPPSMCGLICVALVCGVDSRAFKNKLNRFFYCIFISTALNLKFALNKGF